jgi:hypothetical protein
MSAPTYLPYSVDNFNNKRETPLTWRKHKSVAQEGGSLPAAAIDYSASRRIMSGISSDTLFPQQFQQSVDI